MEPTNCGSVGPSFSYDDQTVPQRPPSLLERIRQARITNPDGFKGINRTFTKIEIPPTGEPFPFNPLSLMDRIRQARPRLEERFSRSS